MRKLICPSMIAATCLLLTSAAQADTIAMGITGGVVDSVSPFGDYSLGWNFTVLTPISVTQLGVFDPGGDGLNQAHDIAIYNATSTSVVSAIVPIGTAGTLDTGFRYVSVAPTLLAPGTYTIAAIYNTGASDQVVTENNGPFTPVPAAELTYQGGKYQPGGTLTDPTIPSDRGNAYFGPNFQFNPVPEPSSCVLFGLGAVGLFVAARRRRSA